MLRKLKLTCFRQHRDSEFEFGNGMIVIRGANEGGKTGMILAAAYALGGATVLPLPLAETVTWGCNEKDLKVELTIEIESRTYEFSRSKAGAECNYAGGKVIGQKEVTAFAAELIGADAKTMTRLMLAKQNSIRGALEEGPAAVAAQIESLANFDLFDRIIERISAKLVTGPTKLLEDRVNNAANRLNEMVVLPPDTSTLEELLAEREKQIDEKTVLLDTVLVPAERTADVAYKGLVQQQEMREIFQRNVTAAQTKVDTLTLRIKTTEETASAEIPDGQLQKLGEQLAQAVDQDRQKAHCMAFLPLEASYPEAFWEGDKASLQAEIEATRNAIDGVKQAIAGVDMDIKVAQTQMVTSSVCGLCNQDVSKFPEVAKKNAMLEQSIVDAQDRRRTLAAELTSKSADLGELRAVLASAAPYDKFACIPGWTEKDENFVPAKLKWLLPATEAVTVDLEQLRTQIASLNSQKTMIEAARRDVVTLTIRLQEEIISLDVAKSQLEKVPAVSAEEALTALQRATAAVLTAREALQHSKDAAQGLRSEIDAQNRAYTTLLRQRESLDEDLKQSRADLEQLVFNNNLLKKVRAARPLIADMLWNTVLSTVSVTFSQMRMQPSVVTKDKDGFKVNGKACEGLSGSALDLLGLAIRMALVKTFLPHISMLILDEITAACDNERTAALLGFVASAGFDQTILVTHEEISESFADHLIQL